MEHDKQAEEDHEEVEEDEDEDEEEQDTLFEVPSGVGDKSDSDEFADSESFFVSLSIFDVLLCKVQRMCCPKFNRNAAQFFLSYLFHCYNFCRRNHRRKLIFNYYDHFLKQYTAGCFILSSINCFIFKIWV